MPDWAVLLILVVALVLIVVLCVVAWPWSVIILLCVGLVVAFAALIASYLGVDVQALINSLGAKIDGALQLVRDGITKLKSLVSGS